LGEALFILIVSVIGVGTAFNTLLIIRTSRLLQKAPGLKASLLLPQVSALLPGLSGVRLGDGRRVHTQDFAGREKVLAFVSPRCPKCREKLTAFEEVAAAAPRLGFIFRLIIMDKAEPARTFLRGTSLTANALLLERESLRRLNPKQATPLYIFVNENDIVQAAGYVGDEDWEFFCDQVREADNGETQGMGVIQDTG